MNLGELVNSFLDNPDLAVGNLVPNPNKPPDNNFQLTRVISLDELISRDNTRIHMVGRTTGYAFGTLDISGLGEYSVRLGSRRYMYGDLFTVRSETGQGISSPGDSGASLYTDDGALVGFVVAGSDKHTFFQLAETLLKHIDAELLT